ncbi:hypothetical protein TNCV_2904211 [Trichonephila clavipes]|nr:hypothetical protein TNCV_2904211 [Trichonephila clavipes]
MRRYAGTAIRGFSSGQKKRRQTAESLDPTQATGRPISRFTVARRLHGGGLFARRPVRGAMGLQFLFMDDNAPYHHTVAAEQLSEILNVWIGRHDLRACVGFSGGRLAARTLPPVTIREL